MIYQGKIDSKGRIVLPSSWRDKVKSQEVLVVENGNQLIIIPKVDPDLSKYLKFLKTNVPGDIYPDYHDIEEYPLSS
ncbi:MAG: AbrB/MazE/SpoVT family DNA-binding domain-containing protein [Promethearchaeota archaeon]